MVKMVIDNQEVEAKDGLTLLDVFRKIGIKIPTLCYHEAVTPYAACRLCLVEITMGQRNMLAASCLYPVTEGVVIKTSSERVLKARRMVAELLLARCPDVPEVIQIAQDLGIEETRFKKKDEKCVLCGLCVRGCKEIAGVGAIGFANRGVYAELVTPFNLPSEICVGCTTCIYLCPTDAIKLEEIRRIEMPHHFEESFQGVKCTLCGEFPIIPEFQEVEAIHP